MKDDDEFDRVPTPEERAANHKAISKMHVVNRFRLMFGLPLIKEVENAADTDQHSHNHDLSPD